MAKRAGGAPQLCSVQGDGGHDGDRMGANNGKQYGSEGKGSSSISSDVSSSTEHTPTRAQKNVATSEGRHLVFISSSLHVTELAIFGKQNMNSWFCSLQCKLIQIRGQEISQFLQCCCLMKLI